MNPLTIAFLGDIFAAPGRRVVQQQLPRLREEHRPDLVIANAENARSGSGLTPDLYRKIRGYGIDAITLGDHTFRAPGVTEILETPDEPIARPANLATGAVGRLYTRVPLPNGGGRSLFVVTVLGRVFFPLPADDPFAAVDRVLASLPEPDPLVLVEAHMEATSEKAALARHLDGRALAVVGTHTHVPTADARILPAGTGFITDVGMCGPYDSIIGRDAASVLRHMTTGMHVRFGVGEGGEALCGVVVRADVDRRRTVDIERVQYDADRSRAPFV
ncbi:MAG: TIGR00282 family metallophosphoesterase [Planctomycetota bacterium]